MATVGRSRSAGEATATPRPAPLTVAAVLTWVFALAFLVLAAGSLLQLHGMFSAGVGVMLAAYGALLAWIGWAAWRCRFYIRGALVGSAVLHLLVAVSSLSAENAGWWLLVAALCLTIIVCGLLPSTTAALQRAQRDPLDT